MFILKKKIIKFIYAMQNNFDKLETVSWNIHASEAMRYVIILT